MQLLLQPLLHDGRQIFPIQGMGLAVADVGQRLIAVRNHRRTLIRPHRRNGLDLIRDQVGVGDHHLFGLVASQILKFLQHLLRGTKVQRRLIFRILKSLARHDDPAVHLVRRIQKMYVAGGYHRLIVLLSQLHDPPVDVLNILDGIDQTDFFIVDHEGVVSRGLDLQIIIKIHNPRDIRLALFIQQGAVQLSRLAGASQDQPLPALLQEAFGNSGPFRIIVQMGLGNQPVQVHAPRVVLRQDDGMVGGKAFDDVRVGIAQRVHFFQGVPSVLLQHFTEADENLRRGLRIIHRSVVVFQRNAQSFGHRIQGMLRLVGKQDSCNAHRVHIGIVKGKRLSGRVLPNKTGVKTRVVRHQHAAFTEGEKFRQHLLNGRSARHHFVVDAGELFDLKGNGYLGIYEGGEPVRDLPLTVFHLHHDGADLDDPVFHRRKACGFNIEYHIAPVQRLALSICDDLLQIVHQIGLHAVDHLEEIVPVRVLIPGLLPFFLLRLPQVVYEMIGVREGLHHAVVRDGDGRMAPLIGPLHDVLHLGNAVHIAHFCMAVQLHPLAEAVILTAVGEIADLFQSNQ